MCHVPHPSLYFKKYRLLDSGLLKCGAQVTTPKDYSMFTYLIRKKNASRSNCVEESFISYDYLFVRKSILLLKMTNQKEKLTCWKLVCKSQFIQGACNKSLTLKIVVQLLKESVGGSWIDCNFWKSYVDPKILRNFEQACHWYIKIDFVGEIQYLLIIWAW